MTKRKPLRLNAGVVFLPKPTLDPVTSLNFAWVWNSHWQARFSGSWWISCPNALAPPLTPLQAASCRDQKPWALWRPGPTSACWGPQDKEPPSPQRPGWVWFKFHLLRQICKSAEISGECPSHPLVPIPGSCVLGQKSEDRPSCVRFRCVHLSNNFLVSNFKILPCVPFFFFLFDS